MRGDLSCIEKKHAQSRLPMSATSKFIELKNANRQGRGGVAVSVCSAHPLVLRAALRSAKRHNTFALIESTSNQVDQYGGYTGMTPPQFVSMVNSLAENENFPISEILLGGDHLGPNSWRMQAGSAAMVEACKLVEQYVTAGYRKIHLDASFVCADDTLPLSPEVIVKRCVEMARTAESVADPDGKPIYVIGTEVPVPGGVTEDEAIAVTTPSDVRATLAAFRSAFVDGGLEAAWERVTALVIQPGVEFGDAHVHDFVPSMDLASTIEASPDLVYEAHSTDYQSAENLDAMVRNHYFVLKVGPWLTFALREGLFALEMMEKELSPAQSSNFRQTLLNTMRRDPGYWKSYYTGSADEIERKLAFSYSDRARYYLGHPDVCRAQEVLFANLAGRLTDGLLSQYMPLQYQAIRSGRLLANPQDLAIDRVCNVLDLYHRAGRSG